MAAPSNPGWKFGYVPSPGEWNNTFAGKVDYPAPVAQGGTGGQDEYSGNYNLQQRAEIITPTQSAAALTFYSVRTDLTATTIALPPVSTLKAGDWIDLLDTGNNAKVNNIRVNAAGDDLIINGTSSDTSLLLFINGVRCILVSDGISTWRAQAVAPTISGAPVPRQISATSYTLQETDAGQYLQFTAATPVAVTVPPASSVAFTLGAVIVIEQYGAGSVTIGASSPVVLNGRNGLTTGGQYAVAQIKNGSAGSPDTWTILGDTTS